jgi:hypothetical protein
MLLLKDIKTPGSSLSIYIKFIVLPVFLLHYAAILYQAFMKVQTTKEILAIRIIYYSYYFVFQGKCKESLNFSSLEMQN